MKQTFLIALIILATSILSFPVCAYDTVHKRECMSLLNMDSDCIKNVRTVLLNQAKRAAAAELYGEMISAATRVDMFVLKEDEVRSYTAGRIRLQGSPVFFNGQGFGEVCVSISAYITESEEKLFQTVQLQKKISMVNPNLSVGEVKQAARQAAIVEALYEYDGRLRKVGKDKLLALIRKAHFSNEMFVHDSAVYTTTFIGEVLPVEADILAENPDSDDLFNKTSDFVKKTGNSLIREVKQLLE